MTENPAKKPVLVPSYPPGVRVCWFAINGLQSGITEGFRDGNYLVRLYDGRYVIVHEKSIKQQ